MLSDELDDQGINGAGGNSGTDLNGILQALTDPADPQAVADFNALASTHAGGVDGLWANKIRDVSIVCGPQTYQYASRTFQTAANYQGDRVIVRRALRARPAGTGDRFLEIDRRRAARTRRAGDFGSDQPGLRYSNHLLAVLISPSLSCSCRFPRESRIQ